VTPNIALFFIYAVSAGSAGLLRLKLMTLGWGSDTPGYRL